MSRLILTALGGDISETVALEKDPELRFANADAFRRALERRALAVVPAPPITRKSPRAWLVPVLQFAVTCTVILLPTFTVRDARQKRVRQIELRALKKLRHIGPSELIRH